ncbi:DNA methyltransferase [Salarchaeum japonicum]|jgi:DNA modification methylase/uncharacterized protein YegP (UPF0339 family)|uniref:site-specific DNA-methyltransferase (cytosine-N(4)-specific) n=1 Tax=Salarchaeum japonicum TaxID=555573 RepID=A0AAV3SY92_9EURY|nr:DNA methyltransferase [Salarchaeum japonicum]
MSDDASGDSSISYDDVVSEALAERDLDEEIDALSNILSENLLGDRKALIEKQMQLGGFEGSVSSASDVHDIKSVFQEHPEQAKGLLEELQEFFDELRREPPSLDELKVAQGPIGGKPDDAELTVHQADATKIEPDVDADHEHAIDVAPNSVDLIITSPPYWQKRDYGIEDQLGQEDSAQEYVEDLVAALDKWREFLRPGGSIFLNVGDTYKRRSITGIPGMFVQEARNDGWTIRNEIVWEKKNGIPSSAKDRLANRHEAIFHLTNDRDYFYDLYGYSKAYGNGSNGGDVWEIAHDRNTGDHLAPFPTDLVRRIITLACPPAVCPECGHTADRELERDPINLDTSRTQARRALEIYNVAKNRDNFEAYEDEDGEYRWRLTSGDDTITESEEVYDSERAAEEAIDNVQLEKKHLNAIQKVGISDAGKAKEFQDGAGRNAEDVQELADNAKKILGGYFREFTFPKPTTKGWTDCDCEVDKLPGLVMDPFAGSGTTLEAADELGYRAVGVDLDDSHFDG